MANWIPIKEAERLTDGRFKTYGWGGVDLVFLTNRDVPLCPHCASELEHETDENDSDRIEYGFPKFFHHHDGSEPIECERCCHTMRP